jgi:predicted metal-dependent HD superfamily phosphohydrolase
LILCTLQHTVAPIFPTALESVQEEDLQGLAVRAGTQPQYSDLAAVFLDLDLSILGAEEERYMEYTRRIREEYGNYSWEDYRRGRAKVLKSFVARDRLYFSDYFYKRYEGRARENIQREIQSLIRH